MNSELAGLAARLTAEYEAAERDYRAAQAKLRAVQGEIARVRNAAKLLGEPDPFAEALEKRRREASRRSPEPGAPKPRSSAAMPTKDSPRGRAEALFAGPREDGE
jgi:hypothetical protein